MPYLPDQCPNCRAIRDEFGSCPKCTAVSPGPDAPKRDWFGEVAADVERRTSLREAAEKELDKKLSNDASGEGKG